MRFLADMGVDVRVVRWLRDQGHNAIHLRDEGLHRVPNGEIFEKGIAENRVLLTFDLDFGEVAACAISPSARPVPTHDPASRSVACGDHITREMGPGFGGAPLAELNAEWMRNPTQG